MFCAKHILKPKCAKHTTFGQLLEVLKSHTAVAGSTRRSQNEKGETRTTFGPYLDAQLSCAVESAPFQNLTKRLGFVAVPQTMAGGGNLMRIWKDAFLLASSVEKTSHIDRWTNK